MAAVTQTVIPQIIAVVPLSRDGRVRLTKIVKEHLGSGTVHLAAEAEVLATTCKGRAAGRGRARSPSSAGHRRSIGPR